MGWQAWADMTISCSTAWMQERGVPTQDATTSPTPSRPSPWTPRCTGCRPPEALPWDGWERLDTWLTDRPGVQDDDDDDEDAEDVSKARRESTARSAGSS